MSWDVVIGIETHVQLKQEIKFFQEHPSTIHPRQILQLILLI